MSERQVIPETELDRAERLAKLAAGRPGAQHRMLGDTFAEAIARGRGYYPSLAGQLVRNADDPEFGYKTPGEARNAAKRYRCGLRRYLRQGSSP